MADSDGIKTRVTDGQGDGIVAATNDPDGSILQGLDGDDHLRGGRYDDIIRGGEGDDTMRGGDGADVFQFFGFDSSGRDEIGGTSDTDKIYDLDFSEGDQLSFANYGYTFTDASGLNAFGAADADGNTAHISSWEGLAAFITQANASNPGSVTYSEKGTTDVLILDITNVVNGDHQILHITGGYSALDAALHPAP